MTERWRQPAIPDRVEPDQEHVWHDGQYWRNDVLISYREKDIKRIQEGRLCLKCQEPFETPFPETCPVCGYAVDRNQLRDFNKVHQGLNEIGRSMKPELDRLDETHERSFWTPRNMIQIERDV